MQEIRVERYRGSDAPACSATRMLPLSEKVLAECHRVRRIVFVDEQHVPIELEMDDLDDEAFHFVAWAEADEPSPNPRTDGSPSVPVLGTARMRVVDGHAKVERVAVVSNLRRLGVGQALMEDVELAARELELSEILLNAQLSAIAFYEANGYQAEGPEFDDAGIPHRTMRKRLQSR